MTDAELKQLMKQLAKVTGLDLSDDRVDRDLAAYKVHLFLTPGMPAPAGERIDVKQPFRRMFNVCGFPALALPMGFSSSPPGLPLGLQIATKPFEEETIYAAAQAFESATEWHARRPALST